MAAAQLTFAADRGPPTSSSLVYYYPLLLPPSLIEAAGPLRPLRERGRRSACYYFGSRSRPGGPVLQGKAAAIRDDLSASRFFYSDGERKKGKVGGCLRGRGRRGGGERGGEGRTFADISRASRKKGIGANGGIETNCLGEACWTVRTYSAQDKEEKHEIVESVNIFSLSIHSRNRTFDAAVGDRNAEEFGNQELYGEGGKGGRNIHPSGSISYSRSFVLQACHPESQQWAG